MMPSIIGDAALYHGDCREILRTLEAGSVQTCITSPPYFGLRDYGVAGQIGLEATPDAYVAEMIGIFREVHRVLRDDGTVWLNLGDSYAGSWGAQSREHAGKHAPNVSALSANQVKAAVIRESGTGSLSRTPGLKNKDLIGIPWRVAFALQADGWYLRQDIIWAKSNPMPHPNTDRCVSSHEYVFLLSKSRRYQFDYKAIREPSTQRGAGNGFSRPERLSLDGRGDDTVFEASADGLRNKRDVWFTSSKPYKGAHFATYPPDLIRPCVLAGAPRGAVVIDPFNGAGTTGVVALEEGRRYVGIELNERYLSELTIPRLRAVADMHWLYA